MIEQSLLDYIGTEIAYDRDGTLSADDPLLDGVLDSLGILRVVSFIEEQFIVKIDDDDLLPENFATVAAIAELVGRKRAN